VIRMQTPSGGFSYWIGGDEPNLWGTAYATHMLLDAQKVGYAVPQQNIDDAVAFLDQSVGMGQSLKDRYHSYSPGGLAYMHYVLARAGKGRKAEALKLVQQLGRGRGGAEQEQVYLLKAALYLAGDRRFEADLKRPDVSPLTTERKNNWSFFSDLRYRGFMLTIYADLFGAPKDAAGKQLAQLVANGLAAKSRAYHYTTQELVWGVTGLGKIVKEGSKEVTGTLSLAGKAITPDSKQGGDWIWTVGRASERGAVSLKTQSGSQMYMMMNVEGVRENAVWEYGTYGLSVTRQFKDAKGKVVDFSRHALGDLIYVEIKVSNLSRSSVQNVALVDRIPAGWEIENPRLGRGDRPSWVDERRLWRLDHMNLRDDRLEAFGELQGGKTVTVVYAVRAVTAGTYTLPPVKVEAMYDPEKWSRSPGREVRISGPWAGSYL
jgi:uncharacterized repeat protein (TIGR01451 family)